MSPLRPRSVRFPFATLRRRLSLEALETRALLCAEQLQAGNLPEILGSSPVISSDSPIAAQPTGSAPTGGSAAAPPPGYSSLPGAADNLFLDFDGHFESSWGSWSNATTPAYDQDGDPTTFSSGELASIYEIWARVAEDFAPFKINVTTIDPGNQANGVTAVIAIGGNWSDWYGSSAGGVAYVGGFYNSAPNVGYAFEDALGNGNPKYVAEASSHEAGHLFGLQHQAVWSGNTLVTEYNQGNANWAPIMGTGYYSVRTTWYNGTTSSSPTTLQDDMAILSNSTNGFGYKADDFGGTLATAAALPVSGSSASVSGLIGRSNDVDVWSFDAAAGDVSFQLTGATYGSNLDAVLELWDSSGAVIATAAPSDSLGANLSATLSAGTYWLAARSVGDYGDVGQYTITGTIVPSTTSVAAPTNLTVAAGLASNQLTWTNNATNATGIEVQRSLDGVVWNSLATLPADSQSYGDSQLQPGTTFSYRVRAISDSLYSAFSNVAVAVTPPLAPTSLTATAVSSSRIDLAWPDVAGETGYQIERSTDGTTWTAIGSAGQNATSYQDTGLVPLTTYSYRVRAANDGGNSDYSPTALAQTPAAPTVPAAPSDLTATALSARAIQLNWRDNSASESGFTIERLGANGRYSVIATVGPNTTAYIDGQVSRNKSYTYRVRAFNDAGSSDFSNSALALTPKAAPFAADPAPSPAQPPVAPASPSSSSTLPQDTAGFWDSLLNELDSPAAKSRKNL